MYQVPVDAEFFMSTNIGTSHDDRIKQQTCNLLICYPGLIYFMAFNFSRGILARYTEYMQGGKIMPSRGELYI